MKAYLLFFASILAVNIAFSQDHDVYLPELVSIHGGTFQMGNNDGLRDEKPVHQVTLNDFFIGKDEVTVGQFRQFISETGFKTDAEKTGGSYTMVSGMWEKKAGLTWKSDVEGHVQPESAYNYPVINVSWRDANEYCKWLAKKTGKKYRLPTEAEWEYAAGNGVQHTKYSWGNGEPAGKKGGNVADQSAFDAFGWDWTWPGYNDGFQTIAPVGSFDPNEFGLYDMTGNVSEWCSDYYLTTYYKSSPPEDPRGPSDGTYHVIRSSSWRLEPSGQTVYYRDRGHPNYRYNGTGFRIAMTGE